MRLMRMLPCKLTEKEVRQRQERLVTTLGEIEIQEDHFAQLKADARFQIRELEKMKDDLLTQIRERSETRAVECEQREVLSQNAVQVVRVDTGDVIEERPMSAEERQTGLELGEDE